VREEIREDYTLEKFVRIVSGPDVIGFRFIVGSGKRGKG